MKRIAVASQKDGVGKMPLARREGISVLLVIFAGLVLFGLSRFFSPSAVNPMPQPGPTPTFTAISTSTPTPTPQLAPITTSTPKRVPKAQATSVPSSRLTPVPMLQPTPTAIPTAIPTPTPPPESCLPTGDGVTLFIEANYGGGTCHTFGVGEYSDLSLFGLDQNVSSLRDTNADYHITFYDQKGLTGTPSYYDADISQLTGYWNDRARSMRVERHVTKPESI